MARLGRPTASRGSRGPNPVDVHVGGRLRLRRTLLGMSQEKLGEAIGLTFQQVQKYERGTNRVGSSRLFNRAQPAFAVEIADRLGQQTRNPLVRLFCEDLQGPPLGLSYL